MVRDSTLASLEQEYQKLREEFNGSTVNFEKQVGGLKEELQLLREKKISLEVSIQYVVKALGTSVSRIHVRACTVGSLTIKPNRPTVCICLELQ